MVMYVLYVKEKKPEEKADEKTKPGANRNPPSQSNKTTKWSTLLKEEAAALWGD